jgi:aquaporin related protein
VNPARSLAPCIVNRSFTSYHWIYWVGPISGVILAVLIFKLVKALEYETCNGEEKEQSKQLLPQAYTNQTPVASLADVHFSRSSSRIAIISGQKIPPPAPVQTSQNLKLTPSVKRNENSGLPECYADGAGDYRELSSSVCLLSPIGVTLQAISSLDVNEEIDETNSKATPVSCWLSCSTT